MIENFNGIIYLAIFIIHFLAYALYAYRTIFTTKAFLDQYGVDVTGSIMTRFFGSLFVGAVAMALYIMFVRPNGVEGTWGFFNLGKENKWENLLDNKIKIDIEKKFLKEMKELKYI